MSLTSESFEGFAVDAHDAPLTEHVGSHGLVEVDGELVPVEDVPLEAVAAFEGDLGETGEEGFGDSAATELGADEEVFQVDSGIAAPSGVEGKVEGHGCGFDDAAFGPFGDEAVEDWTGAEAVAQEVFSGGNSGLWLALVLGEFADEGEHLRNVGWCRGTNVEGHALG